MKEEPEMAQPKLEMRCQLHHMFTAESDPAADKKHFLCSSDTEVTPWIQFIDF